MKKILVLVFLASQVFCQTHVQYLPGRVLIDTLNYGVIAPVGAVKDSIGSLRTTVGSLVVGGTPFDSTSISLRINSDTTDGAKRTWTTSNFLKNADSVSIRNQSNALYLKNADSATIKNGIAATYAPKASPTFTGRWTGSASIRGTATFTTTAVRVAVYVAGTAANDVVVCTPTLSTVVTTTNLTAYAKTDSLIFLRGASGTSGAVLNWILIR